ncbi:polysaccharide biosynthesis tyrosine autokinase [Cryobacterium sp.]|jgi:capsular exopolysaccharide synthesis family protein|uniref:polysaccharide biosynthesis tyrosine autokinase n=1 Tax=Cryobacterium sp. TaxID=1926290 RepID=UPI0026035C5C|nr:polysaccharide biosynthesis tyrosine autokinase [Cryobacterium sp.]MCU1447381.1 capsular exopolysaccharide family [Cryobacterium sp.]
MESVDYLRSVLRRWQVVLLLGILGGLGGFAYASTLPMMYRATSSVFVSSPRGETTNELVQGFTFTEKLVQSYSQLATMPAVLQPVIDDLQLDTTPAALGAKVSASTPLNTVIIEVTVVNQSPEQAALIANAITRSLATIGQDLAPEGPAGAPSIALETVSKAQPPQTPFSPNLLLLIATGGLVGLALGAAFAVLRDLLDTRVLDEKDLARVSDAPLLGKVGRKRRRDPAGIAMRVMPRSTVAEAYRRIQTNLEFIDVDHRPRTIVVTSSVTRDGKTTTSVNLALALAERSARVLLIDADLRRPSIADVCGVDGDVGLTTVLVGSISADEAIVPLSPSLSVLSAGALPPNPGQLLSSEAMRGLMQTLAKAYDYIVIDSPPLLAATDALGLAHLGDGAIVVARYRKTRRSQLKDTVSSLENVNARVLGIVLNQVKERGQQAYYGAQVLPEPSAPTPAADASTPAPPAIAVPAAPRPVRTAPVLPASRREAKTSEKTTVS